MAAVLTGKGSRLISCFEHHKICQRSNIIKMRISRATTYICQNDKKKGYLISFNKHQGCLRAKGNKLLTWECMGV